MAHSEMSPHVLELMEGMEFPAAKPEIIEYALAQGGSEGALDILQAMPDRIYRDVHDFNRGIGKIEDLPGTDSGWWPARESASLPDESAAKMTKLKGKGQL